MCIDPKEKGGQGTWNETGKEAIGVSAALFLAFYRIPPEAGQWDS